MADCVKVRHLTRRHARRNARRHLPGQHLHAYRCTECGQWHVGHLPWIVLNGIRSAGDWYGRATPEEA